MPTLTKDQLAALKARGLRAHVAPFTVLGSDAESVLVLVGSADEAAKHFAEERARALRNGDVIIEKDGRRIWRERVVAFNAEGATESEHYEWHEDGRRVRCIWYEHTAVGGQVTKRRLRSVWVDFDQVF